MHKKKIRGIAARLPRSSAPTYSIAGWENQGRTLWRGRLQTDRQEAGAPTPGATTRQTAHGTRLTQAIRRHDASGLGDRRRYDLKAPLGVDA